MEPAVSVGVSWRFMPSYTHWTHLKTRAFCVASNRGERPPLGFRCSPQQVEFLAAGGERYPQSDSPTQTIATTFWSNPSVPNNRNEGALFPKGDLNFS